MDDDRAVVKTYVPQYQKEEWADHADDLEMSQSEFVRTMVQAGRRDFEIPSTAGVESTGDQPTQPDGDGFEERIVTALEQEGVLDWDGLVERLIEDVEADLDDALGRLQEDNRVQYRGREGGYVLTDHE